jgi:hypothetical protein
LKKLVERVESRQEVDANVLDRPIAEIQIDIPTELLKYAQGSAADKKAQN